MSDQRNAVLNLLFCLKDLSPNKLVDKGTMDRHHVQCNVVSHQLAIVYLGLDVQFRSGLDKQLH